MARFDAHTRSVAKPKAADMEKHGRATDSRCEHGTRYLLQPPDALQTGRGKDGNCWPPPAQIRTGGITAYGSYLG